MKKTCVPLCLTAVSLLLGCVRQAEYRSAGGLAFGTYYQVRYQAAEDLSSRVKAALDEVSASLSTFDTASVISRVNRNQDPEVDSLFATVFAEGQRIAASTGGAFDLTVAPLVNAWGFGFDPQGGQARARTDSIRAFVGYDKVALKNRRVLKDDPRVQLDASAIAKGYGCDRVAASLRAAGVENYLVEIGGELCLAGRNASGQAWRIGVNKAIDDTLRMNGEVQRVLSLTDCGVATSGNYRQFHDTSEGRVGHTIDPRTGLPARGRVLSATVIAPSCLVADAYATACMVASDTAVIRAWADAESLRVFLIYADSAGAHREWEYDRSPAWAKR